MPTSPICKTISIVPNNWKELEKVIIPDNKTAHFWGVWFEKEGGGEPDDACLMCCYIGENPSEIDNWGHAEEIDEECKDILDTIEAVFGVSFHDNLGA